MNPQRTGFLNRGGEKDIPLKLTGKYTGEEWAGVVCYPKMGGCIENNGQKVVEKGMVRNASEPLGMKSLTMRK